MALNFLPSRNSREAPPPVEMWLILFCSPSCSMALALSPPPMTLLAPLLGRLGDGLGDRLGALIERRDLEDAHRPVPDDGLGVDDLLGELLGGHGTDVHGLPGRVDVAHENPMLGAGLELAHHDVVRRQHHFAAGLGRLVQQLDGLVA